MRLLKDYQKEHTVGGILLSSDQLLWVEELAVGSGSDLVNDGGLQIDKDGTRDVLAKGKKRVTGVIPFQLQSH